LKHDGFITGDGIIISDSNFTLNIPSWDRGLYKSKSGNHVKLIWGSPPEFGEIDSFYIYRKWQTSNYQLIGSVEGRIFEFTDATLSIVNPQGEPEQAYYYVEGKIDTENIGESNIVTYFVSNQEIGKISSNNSELNYFLAPNYPNPFNPTTTIKYSLKDDGIVKLKIYNILGSEVASLVDEYKHKGEHKVTFDAGNLASGVYIYKIQSGNFIYSRKMLLLK
jgi:hypothetical protein